MTAALYAGELSPEMGRDRGNGNQIWFFANLIFIFATRVNDGRTSIWELRPPAVVLLIEPAVSGLNDKWLQEETIMAEQSTRGGTQQRPVKSGEQSHKNQSKAQPSDELRDDELRAGHSGRAGEQGQSRSQPDRSQGGSPGSTPGGTHEQHVKAGQQSHKNT